VPKSRFLLSRRPVGIPPAAIEIEPQHALSHARLSSALVELGFSTDARTEAEKAFGLADNLPNEEKLLLEAQVSETRFDWDKAIEIYRSLFLFSPQNVPYGLQLAHAETLTGRPVMAMDTLKQLHQFRLTPSSDRQLDLAEAEAGAVVSDFRRQKELSARAVEKARRSGDSMVVARAERAAPHLRSLVLGNLAEALALWEEILVVEGRWAEAREALEESRKIAHWGVPVGENLASETLTRARLYAASGRFQEAKREARLCPGNEHG
jgi:tetratricopeptide (TPR) repeat protein